MMRWRVDVDDNEREGWILAISLAKGRAKNFSMLNSRLFPFYKAAELLRVIAQKESTMDVNFLSQ